MECMQQPWNALCIYVWKKGRVRNMNKTYLSMAVAAALAAGMTQTASAQVDTYDIGDTIVTATRTESKDVDTPASTVIVTAKDIRESGALNAADAIAKTHGVIASTYGPRSAAMGTMENDINIRGVKGGALLMVNGNPVSWRGKTTLEEIPADIISRIEIVKGNGSVLYGSEAMSGVVNIITKKGASNTVGTGIGDFGQRNYHVNAGDDRLSVHYNYDKWGKRIGAKRVEDARGTGATRTDIHNIEKNSFGVTYSFSDNLDFLYNYFETEADFRNVVTKAGGIASVGDPYNNRKYTTKRNVTQMNYHDANWKASLYWNTGTTESEGHTYLSSKLKKASDPLYNTRERNTTYGLDTQRTWQLGELTKLIAGFDADHEIYNSLLAHSTKASEKYSRNIWGAFVQAEHMHDDRNKTIIGARETWTTGANEDYSNFSASGSFLHKMDKENNWYASIAQSFIMPTFAQMYGSSNQAIPARDLKPQKGVNYEIGWKQNHGGHTWRAAIFHMDIDDNISAKWNTSKDLYTYTNEDFRNTGIELSCDIKGSKAFSYNYGITWQNPESKLGGNPSNVRNGQWESSFGKIQLTGGVTYRKAKWVSDLSGSYLADRVMSPSSAHSYSCKPYFITAWNTTYSPDKSTDITLTIDNVLHRNDDYASHTSSQYLVSPASYMLSFNHRF